MKEYLLMRTMSRSRADKCNRIFKFRLRTLLRLAYILIISTVVLPTPTMAQSSGSLQTNDTLCLDLAWGDYTTGVNGGHIQSWGCNNQGNQSWTYNSSTRALNSTTTNTCLDVHWGDYVSGVNGGKVQSWACNGQPNQKWTPGVSPGTFVSDNGKCLDVDYTDWYYRTNGGRVQLWDCNGQRNQSWTHVFPAGDIGGTCSAETLLPSSQLYNNARNAMSGEGSLKFDLPIIPEQGVVVVNAWIRGNQRQTVAEFAFPFPVRSFQTEPDSDRIADLHALPNDSRAMVVLDYMSGKGWIVVHSTTFRANLRFSPDISITRSAYTPQFDYASNAATWIWEDNPSAPFRRLRVHMTAKPPIGGVWDSFDDFMTPSVDFQIALDVNTATDFGRVWFQGDSFPNVSVYRYLGCTGESELSYVQYHDRNQYAWTGMANFENWWWNAKYPR